MAYDLGQNCQQYENGINKSGEEQRERNEGGCRQKGEKGLKGRWDKTE